MICFCYEILGLIRRREIFLTIQKVQTTASYRITNLVPPFTIHYQYIHSVFLIGSFSFLSGSSSSSSSISSTSSSISSISISSSISTSDSSPCFYEKIMYDKGLFWSPYTELRRTIVQSTRTEWYNCIYLKYRCICTSGFEVNITADDDWGSRASWCKTNSH